MDEAGRSTQPPIITAPPGLDVDSDSEAASAPETKSKPDSASSAKVPLPAETVGQPKSEPADKPAAPDKDGRKPSFTPTATAPALPSPAQPSSAAAPAPTTSSPAPAPAPARSSTRYAGGGSSSYQGPGGGYQAPSNSPFPSYNQSGYQRSDWGASASSAPTATASQAGPGTMAPPAPAPASPETPETSGFSSTASTAASAVTGAAAGLASSVTAAWRNRGTNDDKQWKQSTKKARKATKRQAVLTLARVEPWSVMKFSFLASVVAFIILFVAVAVLYMVLSALGAFDSVQHFVTTITSSKGNAGTNISHWTSASLILGWTAMLGALNIVLITALSTVGSVVYNLIAKTIGGIEVTLRETE